MKIRSTVASGDRARTKMKYILTIVFGIITILAGLFIGATVFSQDKLPQLSALNIQSDETQSSPLPSEPLTLTIPSLEINASVEPVGLDAKGNMDVPKDVDNVAWYTLGPKPGMQGNAVLAGHFDTMTGAPAIFYHLEKIKKGQEIIVTDTTGKEYSYEVTEVARYPFDNFPLKEVFGETSAYRLNLITCDGTFDQRSNNYSHRVVVYSKLTQ